MRDRAAVDTAAHAGKKVAPKGGGDADDADADKIF